MANSINGIANLAVRVAGCNLAVFGMVGGNLALITPIPNAAMPESRISNSGSTTTPGSPFPPTTSRSFAQTHQTAIIELSACD